MLVKKYLMDAPAVYAFIFAVLSCVFSVPAAGQAKPPQAKDARVGGDATRTRFVADLSKQVEFRVRTLPDPFRIIVDMGDVNFQMPAGLGARGRGLVTGFRFGNFAKGKSRIVIDTAGPVIVENAFIKPPEGGQPARLVIDMVKTTRAEFMARQTETQRAEEKATVRGGADEPEIANRSRTSRPVIVIDPGHGGVDPGTSSAQGVYEKNVVLAFCLELKKRLELTNKFEVYLTRDTDVFIPLSERVAVAQKKAAALLISLHADAIDAKHPLLGAKGPMVAQTVRGASIYTLGERASDAEAQASAARENLSDVLAGFEEKKKNTEEAVIIIDILQRAAKNQARDFSNMLVSHLSGKVLLNSKAQRFADFIVLRAPDVPSVLIELGYLSNPEDEKDLVSPEWRKTAADHMSAAIVKFFARAQGRLPF
jgi:N-acetylmuramoyl-L-alanine amidase